MKKQKDKKAQIGTLFANFVMTIIIVFVLAGFIISSSAIKSRYDTDVNMHKLTNIDTYNDQFKLYQKRLYEKHDEKIKCEEVSIYKFNLAGGKIFFTINNKLLYVKQYDTDWTPFSWSNIEKSGNYILSKDTNNEVRLIIENSNDYVKTENLLRSLNKINTEQKPYTEQIKILQNSELIEDVGYDC